MMKENRWKKACQTPYEMYNNKGETSSHDGKRRKMKASSSERKKWDKDNMMNIETESYCDVLA